MDYMGRTAFMNILLDNSHFTGRFFRQMKIHAGRHGFLFASLGTRRRPPAGRSPQSWAAVRPPGRNRRRKWETAGFLNKNWAGLQQNTPAETYNDMYRDELPPTTPPCSALFRALRGAPSAQRQSAPDSCRFQEKQGGACKWVVVPCRSLDV